MAIIQRTKFQLEDRWVPFGRARLENDHIRLSGLGYHQKVQLSSIQEMYWHDDLIALKCDGGKVIELIMRSAALWRYELHSLCSFVDAESKMGMFMRSVREDIFQAEIASGDGMMQEPVLASGDGMLIEPVLASTDGMVTGDGAEEPVEVKVSKTKKRAKTKKGQTTPTA